MRRRFAYSPMYGKSKAISQHRCRCPLSRNQRLSRPRQAPQWWLMMHPQGIYFDQVIAQGNSDGTFRFDAINFEWWHLSVRFNLAGQLEQARPWADRVPPSSY